MWPQSGEGGPDSKWLRPAWLNGVSTGGAVQRLARSKRVASIAVSTGTDKTMINVMRSAVPVTAKRRFMIRNTLVIDQTQFACFVDGGGLGMHMQLAVDAFDVGFDRVPR
jgi:hypothetical protein